MLHLQRSYTIKATPDAVWAVLGRYMHIDEFAPYIVKVDALTEGDDGVGSKRRNHFDNGSSMVEEVTEWRPNQNVTMRMSEMGSNPIHEATADISIQPLEGGRSTVKWTFDFRMKYGPLGWLMGQTMLKMVMGKIIVANLKGLADKVETQTVAA